MNEEWAKVAEALERAGMSQEKLADSMGMKPQALRRKINRGKLSVEEMQKIAKVMGAKYKSHIELPDGTEVGIRNIFQNAKGDGFVLIKSKQT